MCTSSFVQFLYIFSPFFLILNLYIILRPQHVELRHFFLRLQHLSSYGLPALCNLQGWAVETRGGFKHRF